MSKRTRDEEIVDRNVVLIPDPPGPLSPPPPKPAETKAARFVRLANRRVPKAIKALDGVARLGNRAIYEHTPAQAGKILELLGGAVIKIKMALDAASSPPDTTPIF